MNQPLAKLRALMAERKMDAYLVCTGDFHQSEYFSTYFETTRYLSHFTGENCTLVILPERALLWTDGRFFVQAEAQMDPEFELMRMGVSGVPTVADFLAEALPEGGCLGFDGRLVSVRQLEMYRKKLDPRGIRYSWSEDLVDLVWDGRPPIEPKPAFLLEEKYTGESAASKLARLREKMAEQKADVHILSSLEDIAWLFNIRGDDIPCTPVVFAFAMITADRAELFVYDGVLNSEIQNYLTEAGVTVGSYDGIYAAAGAIPAGSRVLIDERRVSVSLKGAIPAACTVCHGDNPTAYMKAVKNETEIAGWIDAHIRDGVAMVRFSKWLKEHIGKERITEISASDVLEGFRREQPLNHGLSFETISAYADHAAMMHYSATPETDAELKPEGFLLVDSGGHYLNGTTDITRTYVLGPVTEKMKEHFTAVVRGMLNLSAAKFLEGATGQSLDILARQPMWDMGIDYRCGTGHGVGFLLSVHEGPQDFRPKTRPGSPAPVALVPGMITTDEPGIYLDYQYGIRIENELLCVKDEQNEYGQFLSFRHVTYCPIDLDGIDTKYMTSREIRLLNSYHAMVYETLKDYLSSDEAAWLKEATRPVE